jgi:radical SAM protein with 4Fe4S-binding SPASM domain
MAASIPLAHRARACAQIETFTALRRIPGIVATLGVTLSTYNLGQFERTFAACARECPGLTVDDVHLNVAQGSRHYYGSEGADAVAPDPDLARDEINRYRRLRGLARWPRQWLEDAYLTHLDRFLLTGRTPVPCQALRASCFIDPWGVVYPCITYSTPVGRLRETGMRLEPIWNDRRAVQVQDDIWKGRCPHCWTACEAYQSILCHVLAPRRRLHPPAPLGREERPAASGAAR